MNLNPHHHPSPRKEGGSFAHRALYRVAASIALLSIAACSMADRPAASESRSATVSNAPTAKPAPRGEEYAELLQFTVPQDRRGWHIVGNYKRPQSWMLEWVPEGETGQNWTEMITVQQIMAQPGPNMGAFIASTVNGFRRTCRELTVLEQNARREVDQLRAAVGLPADYAVYEALVWCKDPAPPPPGSEVTTRKNEIVWFKGMQGRLGSYLVQRAWHGDTVPPGTIGNSDFSREEWRNWFGTVMISGKPRSTPFPPANG